MVQQPSQLQYGCMRTKSTAECLPEEIAPDLRRRSSADKVPGYGACVIRSSRMRLPTGLSFFDKGNCEWGEVRLGHEWSRFFRSRVIGGTRLILSYPSSPMRECVSWRTPDQEVIAGSGTQRYIYRASITPQSSFGRSIASTENQVNTCGTECTSAGFRRHNSKPLDRPRPKEELRDEGGKGRPSVHIQSKP